MKKVCSILLALIMVIAILPAASAADLFTDLDGHWAKADIEELAAAGVINGMGDGTYAPESPVTRSQFIKLLTVAVGASGTSDAVFADAAAHWSAANVSAALASGILKAEDYPSGNFEPDKEITRDEAALWISRALSLTGEGTPDFTDAADITNKTAVYQTVQAGIINGMGDGTFGPKNTTTRAQSAVLIKRVMNYSPAAVAPTQAPTQEPAAPAKNYINYGANVTVHEFNVQELVKVDYNGADGDYPYTLWATNDSRFTERVNVGDLVVFSACDDFAYGMVARIAGKNHHDYDTDFPIEPVSIYDLESFAFSKTKKVNIDGFTNAKVDLALDFPNGFKDGEKMEVKASFTCDSGKVDKRTVEFVPNIYGGFGAILILEGNTWTIEVMYTGAVFERVSGTY